MKYLVCGEALIDCIETQDSGTFKAVNGGSCYNVALGLARFGQSVSLFNGFSDDMFGKQLANALTKEGVDPSAFRTKNLPATLGFVSLDENGTPAYAFYGNGAADRSLDEEDRKALDAIITSQTRFLHFGSLSLVTPPTSDTLLKVAEAYQDRFILFDPNIRPTVEPDMEVWKRRIEEMIPLASAIKVSTEDLEAVYGSDFDASAFASKCLDKGVSLVCITDGGEGATGFAINRHLHVNTPKVDVIDTVGAGDTFSASLLYRLGDHEDPKAFLCAISEDDLKQLLEFCVSAAAITCTRQGADLPNLKDVSHL